MATLYRLQFKNQDGKQKFTTASPSNVTSTTLPSPPNINHVFSLKSLPKYSSNLRIGIHVYKGKTLGLTTSWSDWLYQWTYLFSLCGEMLSNGRSLEGACYQTKRKYFCFISSLGNCVVDYDISLCYSSKDGASNLWALSFKASELWVPLAAATLTRLAFFNQNCTSQ